MGFTEKVHAYIAAKYYVYLTERFGERGKAAFLHATQYYALQRGRRMAQRAIRDGKELTQETYNYYGEWVNTEEVKALGCANVSKQAEDGTLHITSCPWYTQFQEMGLPEAGALYCKDLDSSISRGFNPFLQYRVDQTLHTSDCCIHRILTGDISLCTFFLVLPRGNTGHFPGRGTERDRQSAGGFYERLRNGNDGSAVKIQRYEF